MNKIKNHYFLENPGFLGYKLAGPKKYHITVFVVQKNGVKLNLKIL